MSTQQYKTQLESIIDEISNDPKAPLKVPAALIKPDILTVNTQKFFSIRKFFIVILIFN